MRAVACDNRRRAEHHEEQQQTEDNLPTSDEYIVCAMPPSADVT